MLPKLPLAKIDQQYLTLIHDAADVQVLLGCRQYPFEGSARNAPTLF